MTMSAAADRTRRCAVIYNPIKIQPDFRETVAGALDAAGWRDTLWLETTEEDAGVAMIRKAIDAGVDRVIGAGGDGTVRVIADGLAGTGITLGIVPAGTGNLLARNLGLPLDGEEALAVALTDQTRSIDLVSLTVDDGSAEHFAVMAGTGIDAMIMNETNPKLKAKVGSAAYFVAAAKAVNRLPMRVSVKVDDSRPIHRKAMLVLVGNVGELQAGITLLPNAVPDDGMLDVFIASPRSVRDWLKLAVGIVSRRRRSQDPMDAIRGRRVEIRLARPDNYQLDGDMIGLCRVLRAEVVPNALAVCVGEHAAEHATDHPG
jgi:YegS/Rv2252/BmrU family lipid kinase